MVAYSGCPVCNADTACLGRTMQERLVAALLSYPLWFGLVVRVAR